MVYKTIEPSKGEKREDRIKSTLPVNPKFSGRSSVDCSINFICAGDGVQVVAQVPLAGPVPPPTTVVIPGNIRTKMLQNLDGKKRYNFFLHFPFFMGDCRWDVVASSTNRLI